MKHLEDFFFGVLFIIFIWISRLLGYEEMEPAEERIEDYGIGSGTLPVSASEETTSA